MYQLLQELSNAVAETDTEEAKWVIGTLGSNGMLLKSQGMTVKMSGSASTKLVELLKKNHSAAIRTTDGKKFFFMRAKSGEYHVYEEGKEEVKLALDPKTIENLTAPKTEEQPDEDQGTV